jgi:hypothetical protein
MCTGPTVSVELNSFALLIADFARSGFHPIQSMVLISLLS